MPKEQKIDWAISSLLILKKEYLYFLCIGGRASRVFASNVNCVLFLVSTAAFDEVFHISRLGLRSRGIIYRVLDPRISSEMTDFGFIFLPHSLDIGQWHSVRSPSGAHVFYKFFKSNPRFAQSFSQNRLNTVHLLYITIAVVAKRRSVNEIVPQSEKASNCSLLLFKPFPVTFLFDFLIFTFFHYAHWHRNTYRQQQ